MHCLYCDHIFLWIQVNKKRSNQSDYPVGVDFDVDSKAICLPRRINISSVESHRNALRSDPSDWTKDRHKLSNSTIIELDRSNLYQFSTVKRLKPFSINHFYFYLFHAKETVSFYLFFHFQESPCFLWLVVVSK